MKIKVWSWRDAIRQSDLPPTTKLVLYNLSIYMNEVGKGCFPSTETQANDTGLSKKSICTHLKKACDKGFLIKSTHGFSGQGWKRNEYTASCPKGGERSSLSRKKVVNVVPKGGEPNDQKVVNVVHSNTPLNTSKKMIGNDDINQALSAWNAFAKQNNLSESHMTSNRMMKALILLQKIGGINSFKEVLNEVSNSQYLLGNVNNFKLTFDKLIEEDTFYKIKEKHYEDRTSKQNGTHKQAPRKSSGSYDENAKFYETGE